MGSKLELFLGTFIGAMTWSGSVIAFLKLSGRMSGAPITFGGQHMVNLVLAIVMVGFGLWFFFSETTNWTAFATMTAIAFVLGFLIIIPIGGADMPVVISMLNSYSGWAAAGIGFSLGNPMLIIAGSLVGSSGAILSYIMCKAMNRPFLSVILGGFGSEGGAAAAGDGTQKTYRSGSADDARIPRWATLTASSSCRAMGWRWHGRSIRSRNWRKSYTQKASMCVLRFIRSRAHAGTHERVCWRKPRYLMSKCWRWMRSTAIFPTRTWCWCWRERRGESGGKRSWQPDIWHAHLDAHKARTVMVVKRSMAAGYAGLDNDLFYMDKTMMVFGDAKKVVEEMVKAL